MSSQALITILLTALIIPTSVVHAKESYFDSVKKEVVCSEALPRFTLGRTSNPTNNQVKSLCTCIWKKFPEAGQEQKALEMIRQGKDPGINIQPIVSKFGDVLKACGGYNL